MNAAQGATMHGKMLGLMGLVVALAGTASAGLFGTDYNNIEYLCCDWGPAMTLPTKTNEVAQFSDTEEEIYFLKQVTSFTRKKRLTKDIFNGRDYEDIGKGLSIYLCKMKADGSGKTEIKELWKNPAYPVDTQTQSTWMSVNVKTRTIALSIAYAGSDLMGLWTMKLDGSELREIITPKLIEGHTQSIDSPSWTPDGQWIVFGEALRGGKRSRIARCGRQGQNLAYLAEGSGNCQPRVSPDGRQIAYIHWVGSASRLYLMNFDGMGQHPLPNPSDKRWGTHGGLYPAWSPDGKNIYYGGISGHIIDVSTGKILLSRSPQLVGQHYTCGWPQWGRLGFVSHKVGAILVVDTELREAKQLGLSTLIQCQDGNSANCRW